MTFQSDASNLVAGDTNDSTDVFVADLMTWAVIRVSVASDGAGGNGMGPSTGCPKLPFRQKKILQF